MPDLRPQALMIQRITHIRWVLETEEDGESLYLHPTPGDWGPQHTLLPKLDGALDFETRSEAVDWLRRFQRGLGWQLMPVQVRIHATYEVID